MSAIHNQITARILAMIDAGKIPWRSAFLSAAHSSIATRRPYRGINTLLLSMDTNERGYTSPWWCTLPQGNKLGGKLRPGSLASTVLHYHRVTKSKSNSDHSTDTGDDDSDDNADITDLVTRSWLTVKGYRVFNASCFIGLPEKYTPTIESPIPLMACANAQRIVDEMPQRPTIKHNFGTPCYSPSSDIVSIPTIQYASSPERYYKTLFHELAHSTGHPSRLKRDLTGRFGDASYAREELIAEITAAFLCGTAGIVDDTIENTVAYLQSWRKVLSNDPKLIVQAANAAQKAADFICPPVLTPEQQLQNA